MTSLEIWKFKNRQSACEYLKYQRDNGNSIPMRDARVRMKKYPSHKWANRGGNVAVIKIGQDPGGNRYLFTDGISRYDYQDQKES